MLNQGSLVPGPIQLYNQTHPVAFGGQFGFKAVSVSMKDYEKVSLSQPGEDLGIGNKSKLSREHVTVVAR